MTAYIDTSALAKCYIREPRSLEVLEWAAGRGDTATSALTLVEFRCLLARRRRAGQIGPDLERRALAELDGHVRGGGWRLHPGSFGDFAEARDLIDVLPNLPLRTPDAMHLAAARVLGAREFGTADKLQAEAARALGFDVSTFY